MRSTTALARGASMFSSRSLLCFILLHASTSRASPSVPVSTQAIVTTITAPTVSNSLSTSETTFESTSTFEDIQTITTVDSNGNPLTTTIDNGPTSTVIAIVSDVVVTIPITAYITFESTLGQTTILGPDPTTSTPAPASTTAAPVAAASSGSPSVVNISPAPADSTETSTYVSSGVTYAPVTTSLDGGSTIMSISSATSSAYKASSGFPTSTPRTQTGGMSTGAKAAIAIAVVVFTIFLAVFLFWLDRLRRQRKAIREQYPAGQAPGDETGIFGFFSPIVGKPYEKDQKDIKVSEKPADVVRKPSHMFHELHEDEQIPPAVEEPQEPPYRRPIPKRNPLPPNGPVSPVSPVYPISAAYDPISPVLPEHRSYLPDHSHELPADPFQKGFPRPLRRFPSHHATRSSGNVNALPEFYEKG